MIIGSQHQVNPLLNSGSHDFRQQINRRITPENLPANTPSLPTPSQEKRDAARQATVHAIEVNSSKKQVETYMNATANTRDESNNTSIFAPDPVDVYAASLKLSRRKELIYMMEQVGDRQTQGLAVNIVV